MQRQKKPGNAGVRGSRLGRRRAKPRDGGQSSSKRLPSKNEERSEAPTGHDPGLISEAQGKPRNQRELGQAIFAAEDPVKIGRELLGSQERGPVRARVFETVTDWAYGKSAPAAGDRGSGTGVRIIWDMPAPPYEKTDSEEGMDASPLGQTRSVSQEQE